MIRYVSFRVMEFCMRMMMMMMTTMTQLNFTQTKKNADLSPCTVSLSRHDVDGTCTRPRQMNSKVIGPQCREEMFCII